MGGAINMILHMSIARTHRVGGASYMILTRRVGGASYMILHVYVLFSVIHIIVNYNSFFNIQITL